MRPDEAQKNPVDLCGGKAARDRCPPCRGQDPWDRSGGKAKAKQSTRAPPKRGLKMDADKAKERAAQLRFGKAEIIEESSKHRRRKPALDAVLAGETHKQVDQQNRMRIPAYRLPMKGNVWWKARQKRAQRS